jgi:serine/threonine-protein kinase
MHSDEQADADHDVDAVVGGKVGKYQILSKLGQGGMGRVYEALNPTISKRVALKLLDPRLASNESAAARFTREAQAASAATSPHIVEIFDAGIAEDGSPFIVMELLSGESLSARIAREARLDPEEAVRIVVQVLRGLIRAHDAGIVHRDLKPDNVFLEDREHEPPFAKVLDFGVSKVSKQNASTTLTREGSVLGTPAYMSPEQAQGLADVDARSDVWSVGAILYECVTGRLPFDGATYEQMIVRICGSSPTPVRDIVPSAPERLCDVIARCMRRDRDERIASARELLTLLCPDAPSYPSHADSSQRTRPVRAASAFGTDSTVEAPGVLLGTTATGRRRKASSPPTPAILVALGVLVATAALAMWSRPSADTDSPSSGASSTTAAAVDTQSAPAAQPSGDAPPSVPAPASPSTSASSSSTASAKPPAPAPAVTPRPRRSLPAPPLPAPSAAPSPKPHGVAGGIELQKG